MATNDDFPKVFEQLRAVLKPYEKRMVIQTDEPDHYCLNTSFSTKHGSQIMFGAVRIMKNYVSFHLMPVYACPDLLDGISPELRKRMQGKACFNLKTVESGLIKELRELTKRGHGRFKKVGFIG